jgi:hypothetical protein
MAHYRPRIERDVSITIGPGRNKAYNKVSLEVFKTLLGVTIDIWGPSYPSGIIETDYGDLILDPKFQGKSF